MPQLDKYIFFNHIVSLTIFFFLIYIFIRKSVVPEISTVLKYRKKKIELFSKQISNSEKIFNLSKSIYEKKGKTYLVSISDKLEKLVNSFNEKSLTQLLSLYNLNFNTVKTTSQSTELIFENRKEIKRINNLLNQINKID